MRFFHVFTSLLTASFAMGMATPNVITKRSLTLASATEIVNNMNAQIKAAAANVNQTLVGITSSSSSQDKAAAAQKVNQQLAAVINAISQGTSNMTSQATNGVSRKRAADDDSNALITAIEAAITELETLFYQALSALGFSALAGSVMGVLGVLNTFIFAAVGFFVEDILPLIGPGLELAAAIIELVAEFV